MLVALETPIPLDVNASRLDNSTWLEFYSCYLNFTYSLFIVPFRFYYEPVEKVYSLHTNKIHTVLCIILQCSSLLYMRTLFMASWNLVQEGVDPLSYFDLVLFALLYGFDLTIKYTFWCRWKDFHSILSLLVVKNDTKPLCTSSWKPSWVRTLVYSITTVYLIPSALNIALYLGLDPSDVQGLLAGIKVHTEQMFMSTFDPNTAGSWLAQVAAVFLTFYTSAFWHYCDVFVLVSILFLHRVTSDFFNAVDSGEIEDSKVLSQYESLKKLNNACNEVAGWAVNVFLTYPLSYYATRLVDMLNNSEPMNRISMCIYLGNLTFSMMLSAKINSRARDSIVKWVRRHGVTHLDTCELKLILHDVRNDSIGISGFFTVTMGFIGDIVDLLLTLMVIVIQFRMSLESRPE